MGETTPCFCLVNSPGFGKSPEKLAEEAGLSNNPFFFCKINDLHSWVVKTGSEIDTTTATR